METRAARPDDVDALAAASAALAGESEGRRADPEVVHAAIAAALADPAKARYFVAVEGGRVVGSLFVTREWSDWTGGWYWWIQGVYVDAGHRRLGVYRRLHDAVRRAAREEGDVREVRLYVHEGNGLAIKAYEALGMRREPYLVYAGPV